MKISEPLLPLDLPQTESFTPFPTPRQTDADRGGRGDLIQRVRGNSNPHFKASISSAAVSPAKTSVSPEKAQALKASAAAYGKSTPELLAKYDHATQSWKTQQLCLDGALAEFSETWPRSGLMLSGTAYQLPPLVPLIDETEFGSLLPTPTARDRHTIAKVSRGAGSKDRGQEWVPPLAIAVQMWPTPRSTEWKGTGPLGSKSQTHRLDRGYLDATVQEVEQITGQLNPQWVDWLMGFPEGWTDLER